MGPEKSGDNRYVPGEVVTALRIKGSVDEREDPLQEGMASHSSILAWRIIPRTEETGGVQSLGLQRVRHD